MSEYIMRADSEPARIRAKTGAVLLDHHLAWTGLAAGDSFVDFGCASGEVVRAAARIAAPGRVVGLDADDHMLRFAREASDQLAFPNLEFRQARFGEIGSSRLDDGAFDHAWSRFVLEYLPAPVTVIREMTRVVRPGGKVTLIDLDGNCIWHHPTTVTFQQRLGEVMADLATTGFDPRIGSRLKAYAGAAGLTDLREDVEPYHWVVGRPEPATAAAWTMKVQTIRASYLDRLFPQKPQMGAFFDEFLNLILSENTMTWSLAHLVQGTKPG